MSSVRPGVTWPDRERLPGTAALPRPQELLVLVCWVAPPYQETHPSPVTTGTSVPNFLPEVLPAVEIGWRLARRFWGHGIATEAARAALSHAFDTVGLRRILSICNVDNVASETVMRKLGMYLDRETAVPSHGARVRVYAITREEHTMMRG
jgi:RimJ/RimL family protein N-acetyltransferase